MEPIALYIHIPYCLEKCPYCDFHSVTTSQSEIPQAAYARTVIRQLKEAVPFQRTLLSIYFGGGTPSLMPPSFFAKVLSSAAQYFSFQNLEITVETNPATADRTMFREWRKLGINRLSFGTQSFNNHLLKKLGRRHTAAEGIRAVHEAQAAGLENINCDLIFGIEGQTVSELEQDLQTAAGFNIPHVSAYQLTVESNTPLAHWVQTGQTVLPPEEILVTMHQLVPKVLASTGLHRYEISNYAQPGLESRHNLQYWQYGDYLGLGSGAVSKIGNRRWRTTRKLKEYLAENFMPEEEETIDAKTAWKERWMMGLRLREGLLLNEKESRWDSLFTDWETLGLAQRENGRIRLTDKGFLLTSRLTQNVFEFIDELC